MSGSCTQDEIEKKRLLALQRKAEREAKNNSAGSGKVVANENGQNGGNGKNFTASFAGSSKFGASSDKRLDLSQYKYNKSEAGVMRTPKQDHRLTPIKASNFFGTTKVLTGTCSMISETRFIVDVDYHQKLIEVFKTIPSKNYEQKSRKWNFHIDDYDQLMTECMKLRPQIVITSIPPYVLRVFRANLKKKVYENMVDLSSIDAKLIQSLMPFQRDGICFGISKKARCFIADDMGLGKTIQALGLAHYYRDAWPLLIVTPSSVRYQWSEAIFTFLPSLPTQYVHQFTSGKDFVGSDKVTIVSYDLLVRSIELFERHSYGFVILDESHCVKSAKAARTKAVQRICAHARHVVLLSGTPALSRPLELYSQINLILPSFMGFHDYGMRYCAGFKQSFGWDYSGSSNMQELQLLLTTCCLIRRLKSDVLKQLPAKIRQVIVLDPALIKKVTKESKQIVNKLNSTSLNRAERHNAILQFYHESSDQRIKAVCNYVSDLIEKGRKFLIYAHHQNVLEAISETLVSNNVRFIRIDGKTSPEQRKVQVDLFQECDTCLVAVLSITAANAGITLTAAQLVVFAELFWNPGILCQAEDRVHRIGQADSVVIQYLVAKNTVDDHLWPLIESKMNVLTKAGLDQDFCLNKADVTEQKINDEAAPSSSQRQTNLDSFVVVSPSSSSQSASRSELKTSDGQIVTETTENFHHLLDLDDDTFEDLDLSNIV